MTDGKCDVQWAQPDFKVTLVQMINFLFCGKQIFVNILFISHKNPSILVVAILKTVDLSKSVYFLFEHPDQFNAATQAQPMAWIWGGTFCLADQWKTWGMSRKLVWIEWCYFIHLFMHAVVFGDTISASALSLLSRMRLKCCHNSDMLFECKPKTTQRRTHFNDCKLL